MALLSVLLPQTISAVAHTRVIPPGTVAWKAPVLPETFELQSSMNWEFEATDVGNFVPVNMVRSGNHLAIYYPDQEYTLYTSTNHTNDTTSYQLQYWATQTINVQTYNCSSIPNGTMQWGLQVRDCYFQVTTGIK